MATRKFVKDLVTSFSTLMTRKMDQEERESLETLYFQAFKAFTDAELKQAGQEYLKDGEYFPPKPKELLDRLPNKGIDKHTRELIELWTCPACNQKVHAMVGGICADCAGLPPYHAQPLVTLPLPSRTGYRIEGRIKCTQCARVTQCIKEEGSESWLCADCYSGLTKQERAARFRDLAKMMEDKNFRPSWAEQRQRQPGED